MAIAPTSTSGRGCHLALAFWPDHLTLSLCVAVTPVAMSRTLSVYVPAGSLTASGTGHVAAPLGASSVRVSMRSSVPPGPVTLTREAWALPSAAPYSFSFAFTSPPRFASAGAVTASPSTRFGRIASTVGWWASRATVTEAFSPRNFPVRWS